MLHECEIMNSYNHIYTAHKKLTSVRFDNSSNMVCHVDQLLLES